MSEGVVLHTATVTCQNLDDSFLGGLRVVEESDVILGVSVRNVRDLFAVPLGFPSLKFGEPHNPGTAHPSK
jgi:hypothetical protein